MENNEKVLAMLQELRADSAKKQKRGLHFMIASVFLWAVIWIVHASSLPILTKNLYTFFCSAYLVPLAFFISKLTGIAFRDKDNPLNKLGILFTVNQLLYIQIVMWIYAAIPDKMLMVYAMVFGAHLLPYGWLYQSKTYYVLSILIPVTVLFIGLYCPPSAVAGFMFFIEILFCFCLIVENKKLAITR